MIGQEMFIARVEEIPQCRKSPRPASGYHCASGWVVCDVAVSLPTSIMECSACASLSLEGAASVSDCGINSAASANHFTIGNGGVTYVPEICQSSVRNPTDGYPR